jgi:glucokinase
VTSSRCPSPADTSAHVVLGVDIGGTNTKWVTCAEGAVLDSGSLPTPQDGPNAVADAITALAAETPATALGVAVPGHLDTPRRATGIIPNLPGAWGGHPLAEQLEKATDLPVVLLNDARAFARAELELGAARDGDDALFLTMGTGIGGAVAVNGAVLRGSGDRLGEIGHMTAEPGGPVCGCGARGCLETVAGGTALATSWSATAPQDRGHESGLPGLVAAAQAGDPHAGTVLNRAGTALGTALGSALALLGLRTVVVGGGVAPALAAMRPAVHRALDGRGPLVGAIDLRTAVLGPRAGAIGAALEAAGHRASD